MWVGGPSGQLKSLRGRAGQGSESFGSCRICLEEGWVWQHCVRCPSGAIRTPAVLGAGPSDSHSDRGSWNTVPVTLCAGVSVCCFLLKSQT